MKVLGTNTFFRGKALEKLKNLGYSGHHNQFRIICKCRGINDANRKCNELGICGKVFVANWCSETGNQEELSLCEKEDIWISIGGTNIGKGYISAVELFKNI